MLLLGVSMIAPLSIQAQGAKKYVLIEHFTNTRCGICGSQNPSFFNTINVESNKDIHHISIHPSIPYSTCVFYQANTIEQDARATFYNLPGTPRASLNGASLVGVSGITASTITEATTGTSPLQVVVTETTGNTRTAAIKLKTAGTIPSGSYKLYAAIVERKVSYSAPNGEATHHNVFRKHLINGQDVTLAANGSEVSVNANYTIDAAWKTEVYVVAYVQNTSTKAILNSGTRFDVTSSISEPSIEEQVSIAPNPTQSKVTVNIQHKANASEILEMTISNVAGQIVETIRNFKSNNLEIGLNQHPKGIYFLKIRTSEGIAVKKFVYN